jgi:Family of unknown function (DUF6364)
MSNITLSVDEATYRTARIVAAERGTSVSGLVREYLQSLGANQTATRQAQEAEATKALIATFDLANEGYSAAYRLTREELYDRAAEREHHAKHLSE